MRRGTYLNLFLAGARRLNSINLVHGHVILPLDRPAGRGPLKSGCGHVYDAALGNLSSLSAKILRVCFVIV